MNNGMMKKALRDRKARGLDITILVGGAEPLQGSDKEQKELGLAPEANPVDAQRPDKGMGLSQESGEEPMHPDEDQDKLLIERELAKAGLGKSSLSYKAMMARKEGK